MDFNKLFEMIKELSGSEDIILKDLRKDDKTIYIELDLVEPIKQLIKE